MKTDIKKQPGSAVELVVMFGKGEFEPYFEAASTSAREKVRVKGFRPGTAPTELADQAVDKEKVFSEAVDRAVRESLHGVVEENQWTVIDKPKVEVLDTNEGGLGYKANLVLFPEIKIGDYKRIAKMVLLEKQKSKVQPAEIEKALTWIQGSRATLARVSRGAEKGDLVEIDVKSERGGTAIPGGVVKGDRFVLSESRYVPGFDEKLVGRKEGEEVVFQLTPAADYWQKDLQGKVIDFSVKVNAVFSRALPAINDEFAKGLGPNFQNLDALKENVKAGLTTEKNEQERERLRAKMIEEIAKTAKVDLPAIMLEKVLDQLLLEVKQMVSQSSEFTDEKLRASLREKARERARANLVFYQIEKQERLEPTKQEVEEEARARNLDPETHYDYAYGILRHRKVFEFLERVASD